MYLCIIVNIIYYNPIFRIQPADEVDTWRQAIALANNNEGE
jgi:hypothetical protein